MYTEASGEARSIKWLLLSCCCFLSFPWPLPREESKEGVRAEYARRELNPRQKGGLEKVYAGRCSILAKKHTRHFYSTVPYGRVVFLTKSNFPAPPSFWYKTFFYPIWYVRVIHYVLCLWMPLHMYIKLSPLDSTTRLKVFRTKLAQCCLQNLVFWDCYLSIKSHETAGIQIILMNLTNPSIHS